MRHLIGPSDAPVRIVLFGDYECSETKKIYSEIKKICEENSDLLSLMFGHFPRSKLHPGAGIAAVAAEAAREQENFQKLHNIFLTQDEELTTEKIFELAASIRLNMRKFLEDIKDVRHQEQVMSDFKEGLKKGFRVTPGLIINEVAYDSIPSPDKLKQIFERILKEKNLTLPDQREEHQ
jgi:protein-disulfide isomerase